MCTVIDGMMEAINEWEFMVVYFIIWTVRNGMTEVVIMNANWVFVGIFYIWSLVDGVLEVVVMDVLEEFIKVCLICGLWYMVWWRPL
jgi:hypothetical protein